MSTATSDGKFNFASVPIWTHLACGWPLIMVAFGGAIGGGLGGAAYGAGIVIWKSRLPVAAKIVLIPLVGISAFLLWALIAGALHSRRG